MRRWLYRVRTSFPAGGVLLLVFLCYYLFWAPDAPASRDGGRAPTTFQDINGNKYRSGQYPNYPATVLFFLSARCPCSDSYSEAVAALVEKYPQLRFFAVFSNGDESLDEIRSYMAKRKLQMPVVKDEEGRIAARVRSYATPSTVIIDALRRVRYQGPLGKSMDPGTMAELEDCEPFVHALGAVLTGKLVNLPNLVASGCAIISSRTEGLPAIEPNDNRNPAGQLDNGVFHLRLVAKPGVWRPEKEDGARLPMFAFQEEGKPSQVPGPLIRVPEGTEMRVMVRNEIPGESLYVRGFHSRPGDTNIVMKIPPDDVREFSWKANEAGTYLYWASNKRHPDFELQLPYGQDATLSGGLIVDPAGFTPDPHERIFVLNHHLILAPDFEVETFPNGLLRSVLTFNGLTWPYTERLKYQLHEKIRWRMINGSFAAHPLHLHGFYFEPTSRRDGMTETRFGEEEREKSVTELVYPTGAINLEWAPDRPGRWLFHCHMSAHFSPKRRLRGPGKSPGVPDKHTRHALEDMSGLVLGLEIEPSTHSQAAPEEQKVTHDLTVYVRQHTNQWDNLPIFSFFPQNDPQIPIPAEPTIPGPPIVLTKGERARIKVVNQTGQPTAVHWHGIELESYFDGVVGWGGSARTVTPMIEPREYFIAEMTPPRAGTFIYHSHFNDEEQLSAGLYGPIIVLDPGERYDPDKDRVFMISQAGSERFALKLNGSLIPPPMHLTAGETYHFRFINITLNDAILTVRLTARGATEQWQAYAKDGAKLPPARATLQPANQLITVGETRDFRFTPKQPGELRLSVIGEDGTGRQGMSLFVR